MKTCWRQAAKKFSDKQDRLSIVHSVQFSFYYCVMVATTTTPTPPPYSDTLLCIQNLNFLFSSPVIMIVILKI